MKLIGFYLMLCWLFMPVLVWSQSLPASSEIGLPFFTEYFPPHTYQAQGSNWSVVQDSRGVMYVANLSGVLEYDGVQWHLIRTDTDSRVRSLAIDDDDTIYVGAWGDLGYLKPDSANTLTFESLIEYIHPDDRFFEDVWGTSVTGAGVFFQTSDRIFRWDGQSMKMWRGVSLFHTAFQVHDQFFVRQKDVGLLTVRGDSLQLIPGGDRFARVPVRMMVPYDDDRILIGTRRGFWLFDGTTFIPFNTEVDAVLSANKFYQGCVLSNGLFALATRGGGVFIVDNQGRLVNVLDSEVGLPDNFINYVYEDAQGGLWMALANAGIARVDVPSALSVFDNHLGLRGQIYFLLRHNSTLYAATGAGLFYMDKYPVSAADSAPRTLFKQVPGVQPARALLSIGDTLLAATDLGIYEVLDNQGTRIFPESAFTLYASEKYPGRLYVGMSDGLGVLHHSPSGWSLDRYTDVDVKDEIRSIVEEPDGTLWLTGVEGIVHRVQLPAELEGKAWVEQYDTADGLPDRSGALVSIDNTPVFIGHKGIFSFRERSSLSSAEDSFYLDQTLMPDDFLPQDSLLTLVQDDVGHLWMVHDEHIDIGEKRPTGDYTYTSPPVLHFLKAGLPILYVENNDITWIGNGSTLIRYDASIKKAYDEPFPVLVRKVTAIRERLPLFGGSPGAKEAPLGTAEIPYYRNALQFEFAAPSFNNVDQTQYQYYLEGEDPAWSVWGLQTRKTYASLKEGTYKFHVRARNAQGVVSESEAFVFSILPPWYRTWWAYALYLVAFVAGTVLYTRYNAIVEENRRAQQQAEELARERVLNERLKQLNTRLQEANESLVQADKLKDEFLANTSHELRTPLTAILGFTSVLQDEVDVAHQEFLGLIHSNGQRLLHTVNSLLDLAKLRAGVINLHREVLEVGTQIAEVIKLVQPLAEQKNLDMDLIRPAYPIYAKLDKHYFERVLYNLIGNAIKFTTEGGVAVEIEQDDTLLHIHIRDTGLGIDEAFLPYIFEEFKQESTGLGRLHEGSGLGLTITARLVELMGGEISVESTKGQGSVFSIAMPHYIEQQTPIEVSV